MVALSFFALLAGAGTALSPCALPVLPALLSASGAGGRRRPFGIVAGLTVTFGVTIIGLAKVTEGVGLGADPLRWVAVGVLGLAGLALALPGVGRRLERPLAPLSRLGPRDRGDGFRSGLLVGGALGFVYTPCAGPILAAVIATGTATGRSVLAGSAYALGSGLALLAIALAGRRLIAGRGPQLYRALGVVLALTAVAFAARLDVRLDQAIARHIPDVSLTASLEGSHAVSRRLADLHHRRSRFAPTTAAAAALPELGSAPDFTGTQRWFNTPGNRPLSLTALRGRVVLIDFWTYTCINCIRTLPYLEAWDARYGAAGLTIVGVHTPEFSFEHDAGNVGGAIRQYGIRYPVVQDNRMATWNAWGNQYWPAEFLVDARGHVRGAHFGEGRYDHTERSIRALLAEAGRAPGGAGARATGAVEPAAQATPETYLGTARAQGWVDGPRAGTHSYRRPASLALSRFALGGTWTVTREAASAGAGATIDAEVAGKAAYVVLASPRGATGTVKVTLDGRPAPPGPDLHGGRLRVTRQRLYTLVQSAQAARHHLTLALGPRVRVYSFTFG